jgi:hypothetical protein
LGLFWFGSLGSQFAMLRMRWLSDGYRWVIWVIPPISSHDFHIAHDFSWMFHLQGQTCATNGGHSSLQILLPKSRWIFNL